MSLLLQALKRAEETKRQRENSAAEQLAVPTLPEPPKAQPFPALEEPVAEAIAPAAEPERIEPVFTASDLTFAPEPVALPLPATPDNSITLEFAPATPPASHLENPAAPAMAVIETPPTPAPVVATSPPKPEPTIVQEPKPATSPDAARHLLLAPRAKSPHRTLPWLVLGGCVLLGGIGAWFWWQFQQLTAPATPIAPISPPAIVASVPASSAENASEPALLIPDGVPALASAVAQSQVKAHKTAATLKPSTVSRPRGGDAAAYIESLPTPGSLPQIERRTQEAAIPAPLEAAWQAYQKGDLATAETQYQRMLALDQRNRDAQLGLAAIAAHRGKKTEAAAWYKKLLALNPQDEDAQTGLAAVDTDMLSERTEARLLQQADRPASSLALGQYYAAHQRWNEAQEHYFIAFSRDPNNADLAFNLAISLDHLSQTKLAGDYYRKALALGRSSFDRKTAEKRLAEIVAGQK